MKLATLKADEAGKEHRQETLTGTRLCHLGHRTQSAQGRQ